MESKKSEVAVVPLLQQQILHLAFISVLSVITFVLLQHYSLTDNLLHLKYSHLVVDLCCFVIVMILSEFAAGNDCNTEVDFFDHGLTAAVLFLVLTALPQLAQEILESSDLTGGSQLVTCVLVIFQDDHTIDNDGYRSFFTGFFILNLIWATTTAGALYRLKQKTNTSENGDEFSMMLTIVGFILATASLTTYIAIEHTITNEVDCSYPHHQISIQAYSAVLVIVPLFVLFTMIFARSYTVNVVQPILYARINRKTKVNNSTSIFGLLLPPFLTTIFLYQFALIIAQTDGVQSVGELIEILIDALISVLSALQHIVTKLIPDTFRYFWGLLLSLTSWVLGQFAGGGLFTRLALVALPSLFLYLIFRRLYYRGRHHYPYVLLLIMLILLGVGGGFLFGLYFLQGDDYELIEIDTNRLIE